MLNGLHWVSNYEGNRWFLVLRANRPKCDTLNRLLQVSNAAAAAFQQPLLYATAQGMGSEIHAPERSRKLSDNGRATKGPTVGYHSDAGDDLSSYFHISIAWTLDKPSAPMQQSLADLVEDGEFHLKLDVDAIKTKIGNAVTNISLTTKQSSSNEYYLV